MANMLDPQGLFVNWLTGNPVPIFNTWANVKSFNAKGDGVTDDTAAILATYNALVSRNLGGTLYFPAGVYLFSSFPSINVPGVTIQGEGRSAGSPGTIFKPTNVTGDDITLNEQYTWIKNIAIFPTVRKTSGYSVVYTANCFQSGFSQLLLQNGYNCISLQGGSEIHGEELYVRSMLGTDGINMNSSSGLFGATFNKVITDNPYPFAIGPVKTWAITTAFTQGDVTSVNGRIYQCAVSGTSAGAGPGPSGLPAGLTAQDAFTNNIIDGTAQWRFVTNSIRWCVIDSRIFSIRFNNVIFINGSNGITIDDAANIGVSTRPTWMFFNNVEVDHPFNDGIILNKGCDFYAINSWIGSSLNGSGVTVASTYKGSVNISSTRVAANFAHGLSVAGGKGNILTNNYVQNNSTGGVGTFHGINIGPNVTDFVITGNQCGTDPNLGAGNNQGWGIIVNAGASDRYIITGNLVSGNVTGGVVDGGAGVNKTIASNF